MSLESALLYLFAILVFAVTPGPGVFALLARGMASGVRSCVSLALGMTVSDLIYLLLAFYGLAAVAENWSEAFTVIRYLGAAYLLYLGWKMWSAPIEAEPLAPELRKVDVMKGFLQGFLISASNPKVILFYIAFLPTFIDLSALSPADMGLVVGLTFAGLMIGLMLVASGASSARRFLQTERAMKGANRSAGALMVAAGAFLIAKG
ncbi:Threonine/homoserine/homoserine lactone efflux protein [Franzmannia pantelleriensis]|uniref:Threonine/homoserine/homoserine lactone efflux protein n=1 Tax=Franzmannia pantelleriensis TaxID=48727 RepID=A0A1G9V9Q1_9GAMM|nr:LysE family translocator [Halomonas pantelleriensis]SDM68899.1 Threonine/homoserine/homoserine lactone efflux protein [Halomonas pantelleriensis]